MYRRIEPVRRMTTNEASEQYPDYYIIMRMESTSMSDEIGDVLYVGDNKRELFSIVMNLNDHAVCGVIEGLNHRRSLGGVVVGA